MTEYQNSPYQQTASKADKLIDAIAKEQNPPEIVAAKIQAAESLRNFDLNIEFTERNIQHQRILKFRENSFQATIQFSLNALKTATTVNAAAIAGLLGILPSLKDPTGATIIFHDIRWAAAIYFIGFVIGGIASGVTYFTQGLFTREHDYYEVTWEHPYIHPTPKSKNFRAAGQFTQYISFGMVVISYLCMIIASCLVYNLLTW